MSKLDIKRDYKKLYNPSSKAVAVVEVPEFQYLMINGAGAPNDTEAMDAIAALFPMAYGLKFFSKQSRGQDYGVMPLEGLWWADDMDDFVQGNRAHWKWTYMIMQPDFITAEDVAHVMETVKSKKDLPALSKLHLLKYKEGAAAQLMHIGPFAAEGPNIQKMHHYIESLGGKFDGHVQKHHEIYLSDFRRVAPEKMKVVLRQPFTPSSLH